MKKDSKLCRWCKKAFYRTTQKDYRWKTVKYCSQSCKGFHVEAQKKERLEPQLSDRVKKIVDFWLYKYRPVGGGTWIYA